MALRHDVWRAIEGRADVTGKPWVGWRSRCQECGLDSGPWPLRLQAAISSLLHLDRHHPRKDHS